MKHGNVALIPDEVWLMVQFFVSKYVDRHAKVLRSKFVRHNDKIELTVIELVKSNNLT